MLQIQVANASHMDEASRGKLTTAIRQMQNFTLSRKPSPYDLLPDADRVVAIGSALAVGGDQWLRDHPRQAQWLSDSEITAGECVKRHAEWLSTQMEDPRWRAPSTSRRARRTST